MQNVGVVVAFSLSLFYVFSPLILMSKAEGNSYSLTLLARDYSHLF